MKLLLIHSTIAGTGLANEIESQIEELPLPKGPLGGNQEPPKIDEEVGNPILLCLLYANIILAAERITAITARGTEGSQTRKGRGTPRAGKGIEAEGS